MGVFESFQKEEHFWKYISSGKFMEMIIVGTKSELKINFYEKYLKMDSIFSMQKLMGINELVIPQANTAQWSSVLPDYACPQRVHTSSGILETIPEYKLIRHICYICVVCIGHTLQ